MYSLNNHATYAYVYVHACTRACVRTHALIVADSKTFLGAGQKKKFGGP